jgi:hypothetical protein
MATHILGGMGPYMQVCLFLRVVCSLSCDIPVSAIHEVIVGILHKAPYLLSLTKQTIRLGPVWFLGDSAWNHDYFRVTGLCCRLTQWTLFRPWHLHGAGQRRHGKYCSAAPLMRQANVANFALGLGQKPNAHSNRQKSRHIHWRVISCVRAC